MRLNLPALLLASAVVLVSWRFEHCVTDTLEVSARVPATNWTAVPGPYRLDTAGERYLVLVTNDSPEMFFRVRRTWGDPLIQTNKLPAKTTNNTQNCY